MTGTKSAKERRLGPLLRKMRKGDTLVISEISRLGRNLMSIMSMLNLCMTKETFVLTVKEKYELGNNINSQVLAFAFGLSAQIERDLISQRTKEALAWRKASGKKLGRQAGEKNTHYKLDKKAELIDKMLAEGKSKAAINITQSFNSILLFLLLILSLQMNSYSIVVLSNPVWPVIGRTGLLLDTKKPIDKPTTGCQWA